MNRILGLLPSILVGAAASSVMSMVGATKIPTVLTGVAVGLATFVICFVIAYRYHPDGDPDLG